MTGQRSDLERAINLMTEVRRILDRWGLNVAAAHLERAHDVAAQAVLAPLEGQADEAGSADRLPLDRTAILALGGTFAVIAAVLGRANVIPMRELAEILAIYATTTSETDNSQGLLIACWAGILREAAEVGEKG
ncbi:MULTISPECIES: hypothetical protein [unclassified Sphingobium]|uniref:hypothetical protein n=1 Tax=unclassified Sphingobium TaxID=2611147 RepID=UPI0003D5B60F|nr:MULTISPECIES: hypothetical protein [unclassified Sphingobium]ETI62751.1 hypothetical protein C100_16270 [Sphingobium sp. C100]HUD93246.1 hypothetical protein [Sphingobium sp.]